MNSKTGITFKMTERNTVCVQCKEKTAGHRRQAGVLCLQMA